MNELRTLYRDDLLKTDCAIPGCEADHRGQLMYLTPGCHPRANVLVTFVCGDSSSLTIVCADCRREVCKVEVGARPSGPEDKLEVPEGFAV